VGPHRKNNRFRYFHKFSRVISFSGISSIFLFLFRAGLRALNRHWGGGTYPAPSFRIVVRSSQQTPLRWQQTQCSLAAHSVKAEPHSLQVAPDFHAGI
jgi:hypothetical protein